MVCACGTQSMDGGLIAIDSGGAGGTAQANGGAGGQSTASSAASGGQSGDGGVAGGLKLFNPAHLPCDTYAEDGGPCVAAHSTVRRLSSAYAGPLYQVRIGGSNTGTGGTTVDIGFGTDGFADGPAQDAACGVSACTISIIYDQSGLGNHLTHAPAGGAKTTPGNEANAKSLPINLGGHVVYGEHNPVGVGYRNNKPVGTATGDNPETIYMVTSGNYSNGGCCFDYGNAETNSRDNGEGTMEAVYFGTCTIWNKGGGSGPWVMGDLENGLWAGNASPYEANQSVPTINTYVTGLVKGDKASGAYPNGHWAIKVGAGSWTTAFDGPRPSSRYNPMRKEGAIILGTGGDNSNGAVGNFFEGVMTAHYASDAADDAVASNIASVYGQ